MLTVLALADLEERGVSVRAGRAAAAPVTAVPVTLPAGPRHHERKTLGLADLAIVAGFCGFGSSLRAARSLQASTRSFKWPAKNRRG